MAYFNVVSNETGAVTCFVKSYFTVVTMDTGLLKYVSTRMRSHLMKLARENIQYAHRPVWKRDHHLYSGMSVVHPQWLLNISFAKNVSQQKLGLIVVFRRESDLCQREHQPTRHKAQTPLVDHRNHRSLSVECSLNWHQSTLDQVLQLPWQIPQGVNGDCPP